MIKGKSPGNYWPGAFGSYKMKIISLQLKTAMDRLLFTLAEFMKLSGVFLEKLYSSDITHREQKQNVFLDALQIGNISELIDTDLGAAITMDEISKIIYDLKVGKARGPDGLPVEIYNKFKAKLLPPLLDMFSDSFERGILPAY